MNKVLVIILFCTAISLHAQEKSTYWDNGNLKSTTNHDEIGNKTGYWKTYYENGELETSGYYDNGKKSGNWDEYHYNGVRKKTIYYQDGLMNRTSVNYENGNTMVTGGYDDNQQKDGIWEQFYINWRQKIRGEYAHGKKEGKWEYYTEQSDLYKVENFKNGILVSKWEGKHKKNAFEDTVVEAVDAIEETAVEEVVDAADAVVEAAADASYGNYYGNRPNGEWKFYNQKGNVIEIGNFINDRKEGKWISYYDNGQLKKEQVWKDNKLMEVLSYFDQNGKALDAGTLKSGNGVVNEYDAENRLISAIQYNYGEPLDWNNWSRLNTLAWGVYENESDAKVLKTAIKWVKRSIELDKNYYNTDTYAALLYKTGNYKQALALAKQAITIAKKDKEDYSATTKLVAQIVQKMK